LSVFIFEVKISTLRRIFVKDVKIG